MKKIIIIDGGPRATFNTASMLKKFAEGASSVSNEIEVKTIRLYALDYKGCMSCMACKIKGKASQVCKYKDALTPVLEEIAQVALLQRLQHHRPEADARCTGGNAKWWRGRQQL